MRTGHGSFQLCGKLLNQFLNLAKNILNHQVAFYLRICYKDKPGKGPEL